MNLTDHRFPLGINTYCLRALRWTDARLLDFAASLQLDAIFLQDSLDPKAQDPAHWEMCIRDRSMTASLDDVVAKGTIVS